MCARYTRVVSPDFHFQPFPNHFFNFFVMNIFVAKLNFDTDSDGLRTAFEAYGEVDSAKVINDHFTGKSRGFGFVEMPDDEQAMSAIEALNESDLDGNTIVVKKAEPREKRGGGGRGGFGGGGGGRGRGGYGGRRDDYGGGRDRGGYGGGGGGGRRNDYAGGRDRGGYSGGRRDDYGGGRDRRDRDDYSGGRRDDYRKDNDRDNNNRY